MHRTQSAKPERKNQKMRDFCFLRRTSPPQLINHSTSASSKALKNKPTTAITTTWTGYMMRAWLKAMTTAVDVTRQQVPAADTNGNGPPIMALPQQRAG